MKAAKVLMCAPLFVAGAALAQEAPPAETAPEPPAEAIPAPEAPAAQTQVSEQEVDQFVQAALTVEQIAGDEALDQEQKQAAMLDAVRQTGLEPQRFNEIAIASRSDAELQQRIQLAAAQHGQSTQ